MNTTINAKQLRASLPSVVERVRKGARYTVIYRSQPAFQIIPVGADCEPCVSLDDDPLYKASAVGSSTDNVKAAEHDELLYRR